MIYQEAQWIPQIRAVYRRRRKLEMSQFRKHQIDAGSISYRPLLEEDSAKRWERFQGICVDCRLGVDTDQERFDGCAVAQEVDTYAFLP